MRFLLPVFLSLAGAAAGFGAGLFLKPADQTEAHASVSADQDHEAPAVHGAASDWAANDGHAAAPAPEDPHGAAASQTEFTKLNNQFVVPVLNDGRVKSMVVLSLSLETPIGSREAIFALEPRIRDMFLQVLFDHANAGGFDGEFTNGANMDILRGELGRSAKQLLGSDVIDVLVTDIARQDQG